MAGGKLGETAITVVGFIEQCFWTHGAIPTEEKTAEFLGISITTIKNLWKDEDFRTALQKRGVDFSPEKSKGLLSIVQLTLANSLLNMHDKRSVREKLQELNISSQQYNAWLRTSEFRDYIAKRGEELFKSHDHEAYSALTQGAIGGDVNALKLFFEMRGIYNPKVQVEVNLDQILSKIIEIIARNVTDPVILAAIADEMEMLDTGGARKSISSGSQKAIEAISIDTSAKETTSVSEISIGGFSL